MATIVPAILEKEKDVFLARADAVEKLPGVSRVQVDFADGKFVTNATLGIEDIDVLNPALTWEAHLMVMEPVDFFDYQMVGFSTVIVHLEAFAAMKGNPLHQRVTLVERALEDIAKLGMKAGLAISPETSVEALLPYKDLVSQFTLLSIEPGEQGHEFIPDSIDRIKKLRSLVPDVTIEVDGGINAENARQVVEAGADLLAVGSALVFSDNLQYSFDELNKQANFMG